MAIDVTAILSFFVDLNGYYLQDSVEDKSFTPANYFRGLFEGTPYTYVLVDNLSANTLNYQDNQSKTERFLYGIDRFKGEYKVQGKVAYIYDQVGSDKDVILHEDLNVNSVKIDVDASGFHTYAKGYGDLPEGEEDGDYRLEVEYISPLAEKYGLIEGPAIKDGKYKKADELTKAVKEQVENSYKISTTIEAIDLTNNGYPEMIFEEGDRVWLYVSRLNLNQQVRVMEIEETFDWEGNIIDASYVVGNEGIASRYKTEQYNTIADFRDIQSGRKKLEYNWLPDAVRRASEIINGNDDSLFKYGAGEIIGINQSNPNGYMRFNTDGLGFSRDGGKTYRSAITYEGIVADAITTGTLRSIIIEGVEIYGSRFISEISPIEYTMIQGAYLESRGQFTRTWRGSTNSHDVTLRLSKGYFRAENPTKDRAISISDFGISTFADGDGGGASSGTIEFFSRRYSNVNGLTMYSSGTYGVDADEIVSQSRYSQTIESNESQIYLRPNRTNRPGNNTFQLSVLNENQEHLTDGILAYGSTATGYTSGLRFSKRKAEPVVWVVNGDLARYSDTKIGAGYFMGYMAMSHTGENFYIGSSSETRSVNSTDYQNGTITYIDHKAANFNNSSSITYKTDFRDPELSGLYVVNKMSIKDYMLIKDVDEGNYSNRQLGVVSELSPEIATEDGTAINLYKALCYNMLATQELSRKYDNQNTKLDDLYEVVEVMIDEINELKGAS
nr:phage tail protein [Oceanobacillus caeni]